MVVMPELVVRGTDRLLHNQRALYLKRLLLFEPRVILTSVPFQLTYGDREHDLAELLAGLEALVGGPRLARAGRPSRRPACARPLATSS